MIPCSLLEITLEELEEATRFVHRTVPATPQYAWPKLASRAGCSVWVKHENHTPTGAFKVRGGLVYVDRLKRSTPGVPGIVSATRGNHGQWLAFAAARAGIPAVIHVPYGNSPDQNSAMRVYFDDTHQVAEGAGAAPLAALMREQGRHANRRVGVILSGGNIERARFEAVLRNITPGTPQPA